MLANGLMDTKQRDRGTKKEMTSRRTRRFLAFDLTGRCKGSYFSLQLMIWLHCFSCERSRKCETSEQRDRGSTKHRVGGRKALDLLNRSIARESDLQVCYPRRAASHRAFELLQKASSGPNSDQYFQPAFFLLSLCKELPLEQIQLINSFSSITLCHHKA